MPYREQLPVSREALHLRRVIFTDRMLAAMVGIVLFLVVCALAAPARISLSCDVQGTCKVEAVSLAGLHDDQRVEWNATLDGGGALPARGVPVIEPAGHGLPLFGEAAAWAWSAVHELSARPSGLVQGWCLTTPVALLLAALVGVPGLFLWFGAAIVWVRAEVDGGVFTVQTRGRRIGHRATSLAVADVAAVDSRDAVDPTEQRVCSVIEVVTADGTRRSLFEKELTRSRSARRLVRELQTWLATPAYKTTKTAGA